MAPNRIAFCLTLIYSLPLAARAAKAQEPQPIPLWPGGAPGSAGKTGDEHVRISDQGDHIVSNVHHPAILPYLPDSAAATGAAVIVIPGGGHRELWMDHEGYRVGRWLADHGVAAFVLKYRLAREPGSTYTVEGTELADVQRAIRLVRSRASIWGIASDRIGVIGFSAGGELAALAGTRGALGTAGAADPVDRESSAVAFMGLVYPAIPSGLVLSKETPPAFLLCGENDGPAISDGIATLYAAIRRAGGSAELHVLTGVGHGFGIREGNPAGVAIWPTLFLNWMGARGMIPGPSVGSLTSQMRDGISGARPVPRYSNADRASAAQRVLGLASPPVLGATVTLTPDAPYAWSGAHLSFWKPSFVLGTPAGGEGGVNFWGIHNEGHVNVGFTASVGTRYLLDCRLLTAGKVTYKIYDGGAEQLRDSSQAGLADGHLFLMVGASPAGGTVSVELWPTPVTEPLGFLGCDVSAVTGAP
ncbi:MAG TPA: alpha/beta hydrolase, partial [Gemmatimonadales bacterium]|nr:alpha/beta hydrolase [Gemmatimonadales bacterium]